MRQWMRSRRRAAAGVLALAAAWCAPAAAQMQMPGSFAVNERGAATYTIPIQVPPGVVGIEPRLDLVYNSQRGNGLLGMGWSLSGLSAITRCPQTVVQDPGVSVNGSVNFDPADRFCLDGQRLMVVAGSYGAAASEYRTERESFSKVTAAGAAGGSAANGPEHFVVKTRSGLTMTYGGSADSRQEAQGKAAVAAWSLSKVSDINGNTLTVTYVEDAANGVSYPARIDYTSNTAMGLAAASVVYFDYETRPDIVPAYHAGSLVRSTQRLVRVRTAIASGATAVMEYRIAYQAAFAERADSYIQSVQQCDAAGVCLPATTWDFVGPQPAFVKTVFGNGGASGVWNGFSGASVSQKFHFTGDFDGDGLTDFMHWVNGTGWRVLLSEGSSWTGQDWGKGGGTGIWSGYAGASNQPFHFTGDFNGDGKTDFMHWESGEGWRVLLSTGSGWNGSLWGKGGKTGHWSGYSGTSSQPFHFVGDFNADGKTDVMYWESGEGWRALLSTGSGWIGQDWGKGGKTGHWSGYPGTSSQSFHFTGDFTGDGKTDLMYWESGEGWRMLVSTGSGWIGQDWGKGGKTGHWAGYVGTSNQSFHFVGDFNGDAKADVLYRQSGEGWRVLLSTGAGWVGQDWGDGGSTGYWSGYTQAVANQDAHFVADFNGDNKSDFMYYQSGSGWRVLLSTGTGWNGQQWSGEGHYHDLIYTNQPLHLIGDFQGTGKNSFMYLGITSSTATQATLGWIALVNPHYRGVYAITPGLCATVYPTGSVKCAQTRILQAPLPSQVTRNQAAEVALPRAVVAPPMLVVTSTRSFSAVSGDRYAQYFYDTPVAEVGTGRGFLGFARVAAWDSDRQTSSDTFYRLDWPFTGMARQKRTFVGAANDATESSRTYLSTLQIDYTCQDAATAPAVVLPGGGAAALAPGLAGNCSSAPGSRYQLWASRTVELQRDPAGNGLAGKRTDVADVDKHGNPARVSVHALTGSGADSGHSEVTDSWYRNDEANWMLGRVLQRSVTATSP
jgi:hypothetical protein